jgi:hypothetical protein
MEPIFASEHEVDVWQVSWTELMYTHLSQTFDVNLQHREEQKTVVSVDRDQLPLLARRLPPTGFFFVSRDFEISSKNWFYREPSFHFNIE